MSRLKTWFNKKNAITLNIIINVTIMEYED